MTEQERLENFKQELKALLEKYNASIGFDCENAWDVYDESIFVEFGENEKAKTLVRGWWLEDCSL